MALTLILCVGMVGCVPVAGLGGVSRQEYERAIAERDEYKKQLDALMGGTNDSQPAMATKGDVEKGRFDAEAVKEQLEIVQYTCNGKYSSTAVLVIKNNSPYDLDVNANATFKDGDGATIGAGSQMDPAVQSGAQVAMQFHNQEAFDTFDYDLTVKQTDDYFKCCNNDLSSEVTLAKNKAVITVTNNGEEAAEFVQYTSLFFKGEQLVYVGMGYCIDNDQQLKPGKSISSESMAYGIDFDRVEVYLTARINAR